MMHLHERITRASLRIWPSIRLAFNTFLRIDGEQWAGAFAYNTFFSLFPMIVLLITITSLFVERDVAVSKVISFLETYVPLSDQWQHDIARTITSVIHTRKEVGVVAFAMLIFASLRSFTTLISAANRAWNINSFNFWRLPLRNLMLLGVTLGVILFGMITPVLLRRLRILISSSDAYLDLLFEISIYFVPLAAMFIGLSLFYKLSPSRPTQFSEVWIGALSATMLQVGSSSLFAIYLNNFSKLNALYGTLGGIMGLLLWIYLSGCYFIFGSCLCSSLAELKSTPHTS